MRVNPKHRRGSGGFGRKGSYSAADPRAWAPAPAGPQSYSSASSGAPASGPAWRCFHCDEVFSDRVEARLHFGPELTSPPACQVDARALRDMEHKLRDMERELARYREEDTDLHRQIASIQGEHQTALQRAEEAGYAKGLRDGRTYVPWHTDLPDEDCTVLVRVDCPENPIDIGFREFGFWKDAAFGCKFDHPVLGWLHLHEAAQLLDAK